MEHNKNNQCPVCGNNTFCLLPYEKSEKFEITEELKTNYRHICTRCGSLLFRSDDNKTISVGEFEINQLRKLRVLIQRVTGDWITNWNYINGELFEKLAYSFPEILNGKSELFQSLSIPLKLSNSLPLNQFVKNNQFIFDKSFFFCPADHYDSQHIEEHKEDLAKKGICVFKSIAFGILLAFIPGEVSV